jgi:hypothetical protein
MTSRSAKAAPVGPRRLTLFALTFLLACDTHRPVPHGTQDGSPPAPAIEVRAAHGELVFSLAIRGGGRFEVTPVGGSALAVLVVLVTPDSVTVSRDGADVLSLRKGPTGYVGDKLRLVAPAQPGALHIIDGIGVTLLAVEPRSDGGTLGRDAGGTPVLEAVAESDRVVIQRPNAGARLGTVHGVPAGREATLPAAILGDPDLPLESRAAAAALVLAP